MPCENGTTSAMKARRAGRFHQWILWTSLSATNCLNASQIERAGMITKKFRRLSMELRTICSSIGGVWANRSITGDPWDAPSGAGASWLRVERIVTSGQDDV